MCRGAQTCARGGQSVEVKGARLCAPTLDSSPPGFRKIEALRSLGRGTYSLRRRLLVTTVTLLKAMAKAAMTGCKERSRTGSEVKG